MRFSVLLPAAAALASCGAPQGADRNEGAVGNLTAMPGSSSGDAAANMAVPAPAATAAPAALPAAFHGVFDQDRAACAAASSITRLNVDARTLRFHESIGEVRSIAVETPRAISVVADWQGEGESWRNTHRLGLSEDGGTLTVAGEGTNLVRVRCR